MQPGELGWSQLAVAALDKLVALCVCSCHPVILLVLVSIDPSCNTDQGVELACESKGVKPGGAMKVKGVLLPKV